MVTIAELSDAPRTLVWVADEVGASVGFNNSWLLWRGATLSDECSAGWLDAVSIDDRDWVGRLHSQHTGTHSPYASMFRMRRTDGIDRLVLGGAAPWYRQDGLYAGSIGACLDVEDLRRNRRAAKEIEAFYRGVMEALDEGTLTRVENPAADPEQVQWVPLVGTSRGAGLLRLARHVDSHGLTRRDTMVESGAEQLLHRIESRIRRGPRHEGRLAIATFRLRPVDAPVDRLGHSHAADLLDVVTGRVLETVRGGDVVGKVDDDTLAVILEGVDDLACAEGVAQTIREAVSQPVRLAGEAYVPDLDVQVRLVSATSDAARLFASA